MREIKPPSPRCLVVEDEVLVGMDLEDMLFEAGFDGWHRSRLPSKPSLRQM